MMSRSYCKFECAVGWYCTFSSGQCVLSLRKGKRFGRSYSAYRPICLSWYFWPLWWSRLNSLWRYCGEKMRQISSGLNSESYYDCIQSYLNLPHAEARACLLVLPPPCLSIRGEKRNRISGQRLSITSLIKDREKTGTLTDSLSSLSRSMSTAFWQRKCRDFMCY